MKRILLVVIGAVLGTITFQAWQYCLAKELPDKPTLIGCINTKTYKIVPMTATGNCYLGNNWQNIGIPPRSQIEKLKKLNTTSEIINRLPIYNFESYFDEGKSNKIAQGYVQTKKEYKIPTDITSQVRWLNARMSSQKKGNCSHNKTEDNMIKCLYARHYGALTKNHWYVKKAFATRQFYIEYFKYNPLFFTK